MNASDRTEYQEEKLRTAFTRPPAAIGMMPFWFWNDDVEEGELLRQVGAFDEQGITGFIIHARIGLSRRVGYLTPEYFRLVRRGVEEAARR